MIFQRKGYKIELLTELFYRMWPSGSISATVVMWVKCASTCPLFLPSFPCPV